MAVLPAPTERAYYLTKQEAANARVQLIFPEQALFIPASLHDDDAPAIHKDQMNPALVWMPAPERIRQLSSPIPP